MKSLDGRELVGFIKERQAREIRRLKQAKKTLPKLAIVCSNSSSITKSYTKIKQRYGSDIGVEVVIFNSSQSKLVQNIEALNKESLIHGIIVQLPLEDPANTDLVLQSVVAEKDVDGLRKDSIFDSPTPTAINWLLAGYNIELAGKNIVLVGEGRLVGAPLKKMWENSGLSVQVIDDQTKDPAKIMKLADVLVSGVGVAGLISSDMVKEGAVVIDAGVSTDGDNLVGDVAKDVRERDDITITPEKGGVGPLTVAALFENVLRAARNSTD